MNFSPIKLLKNSKQTRTFIHLKRPWKAEAKDSSEKCTCMQSIISNYARNRVR